jgi:hypothetical protein
VTVSGFGITGALEGIDISGQATSQITLDSLSIFSNTNTGIATDHMAGNVTISNSKLHDNGAFGADIDGSVSITTSEIFGQVTGVRLAGGASLIGSVIHDNQTGVQIASDAEVTGDRIFGNTTIGIRLAGSDNYGLGFEIRRNTGYSNGIGVGFYGQNDRGEFINNLVYANNQYAMLIRGGELDKFRIMQNTLYQTTGSALRIENSASFVSLTNNIISAIGANVSAISIAADSENGLSSDYNFYYVSGGAVVGAWEDVTIDSLVNWRFKVGLDLHSAQGDPKFVDIDGADNVLGFSTTANKDGGADDNFHLASGSPAIDAGDPATYYLEEPQPNGGRADVGAYGNTMDATTSPATMVQLLTPNGYDKLESAEAFAIQWRTYGTGTSDVVAMINAGGDSVGNWLYDRYALDKYDVGSISDPVDVRAINNPAPAAVYQNFVRAPDGIGSKISYSLPVADGNYSVILQFVEPGDVGVGGRVFDIKAQNTVAVANLDIAASAGDSDRAIQRTFNATATGGTGFRIDLRYDSGLLQRCRTDDLGNSQSAELGRPNECL